MPPDLRPERVTQTRVVERITAPVRGGGPAYTYLGNWSQREGNRCIEAELPRTSLQRRGYIDAQLSQTMQKRMAAADVTRTTVYNANLRSYQLLRYGVPVQVAPGTPHQTVYLIDRATSANKPRLAGSTTRRRKPRS